MAVVSIEREQNAGWRAYQNGEGWKNKPANDGTSAAYFWERGWLMARNANPWQQLFIAIFYEVCFQRQTGHWRMSRHQMRENNFIAGSCASYLNGHQVH